MKNSILKIISASFFLISSLVAAPQVMDVTVDADMLHVSGNKILGRVSYKLDAGDYDSVFVKLDIVPTAGGDALSFASIEGAVGSIHILPADKVRDIWFSVVRPPAGEFIARVTAEAIVSPEMQQAINIVNAETWGPLVNMFSGITEGNFFETAGIGPMPNMRSQDGPHGYNRRYGDAATAFLTDGGLACTWDTLAAYEQGVALAREFRAFNRNVNLGPAMNIVWHPQLGRAFEYYSEDSYLSGKMAAAQVRGIQSQGVIATVKHFVANNMEEDRQNLDAIIDERSLRELFLPQFREAIVEGGALGLMTAYNSLNGEFCTGKPYLMTQVLRKEWGYKGLSMSDWEARVTNIDDAIRYGADILLPLRGGYTEDNFKKHDISYARMHAKNIVYANAKVGALKPGYQRQAFQDKLNSAEHHNLVRKNGGKAIILAKNEGNILPLPKTGKKIFLTGPEIDATRLGGGDTFDWESSLVKAFRTISPRQGITDYLGAVGGGASTLVNNQWEADYIIVAVGVHGEGEGKDRPSPYVSDDAAVTSALQVTSAKTIVLFTGGSAALPGAWSNAPAILIGFGPGQEQGYSLADVIFGDVNPSGKLNVTFPSAANQTVNFQAVSQKLYYPPAHEAHGYFKVNSMNAAPLFAFGHGLSYTTYSYSNLSISPATIKKGDRVFVTLDVTNTGAVAGEEVVQLYLSLPTGIVPVRKQDLRGFRKVQLNPGETKSVTMVLDSEDMAYFKVGSQEFDGTGKWEVLSGTYQVRVGTSSQIFPVPAQPSVSGAFDVQ